MSNPSGEQRPQAGPPTDSSQVWHGPIEAPPPRTPAEEASHQMEILRRELNYYAQHLRKARQTQLGHYEQLGLISGQQAEREQRLRRQEAQLTADRAALEQDRRRQEEQLAADRAALEPRRQELDQQSRQAQEHSTAEQTRLDRLREEFEQQQRGAEERRASERSAFDQARAAAEQQQQVERERWAADHAQQRADLNRQAEKLAQEKTDLAWSEAALHKQREQLQKLRAELTDMQQASQAKEDGDRAALGQELVSLRQQLADQELRLADKDLKLAEQEQLLAASRQQLDRAATTDQQYEAELRNEITALRSQLEEKRTAVSPPPPVSSLAMPVSPAAAGPRPTERLAPEIPSQPVPAFQEEIAAALGLEEAIETRDAEESAVAREDVVPAASEAPAASEFAGKVESALLGSAAAVPDAASAEEFAGPLDFDNGALVLQSVRGLIRADRQRVDEDLLKLRSHKGDQSADSLAASLERAPLTDRRRQLEQLRDVIRQDLERLTQAAAAREPQRAPQQPAKPAPTKTRGTFMGLRRWLGG